MADYTQPTVIQQMIPLADMTSLERLLLEQIFDVQTEDDRIYLSAYESPAALIWVERTDLEAALAAPENAIYPISDIREQLKCYTWSKTTVMLDVSTSPSWEDMLHNIVKRSATLKYISALTSYYCNKMRVDGFGGYVTFITKTAITGKGTEDILNEMLDEAGIELD